MMQHHVFRFIDFLVLVDRVPPKSALAITALLLTAISLPQSAYAFECAPIAGTSTTAPDDLGDDSNTACGDNAGILGNVANEFNSAYGFQSGQQVNGVSNTGVGRGAGNVVTGDRNTAIGTQAGDDVNGDDNIAIGTFAGFGIGTAGTPVSRTVSIGADSADADTNGATASANDAIAIGTDSQASGVSSVAVGQGSNAGHANATAIGQGATTSRANQQVFGTATNTYTTPGINSAASKAAQSGDLTVVTSDSDGDLASRTLAELGLASSGDVSNLQSQINGLGKRDDELAEGIAISLALAQPFFHAGQTFALNVGWGGFDGENAVGVTAAGIVDKGSLGANSTVTLHGGVGTGTSDGMVAGRAGLSFGW